MKARMFWLGCAQSLLPLFLTGCCCSEPVGPRAGCGRTTAWGNGGGCAKSGDCGHAGACGRDGRYLSSHRPLLKIESPCPHGFPPYVPAPLGYMIGDAHFAMTSVQRHVEFDSTVVRQAPAPLPSAADQNAKTLPSDDAPAKSPVKVEPKTTADAPANTTTPETKSPQVKNPPTAIAQPKIAPRSTEPDASAKVDDDLEDAPSPDAVKQPVSVPKPPADETQSNDLPENPLSDKNDTSDETQPVAKTPVEEKPAEKPTVVPDAPAPKGESDGDDDNDGESSEEWPDAPLPDNDLPSLPEPVS
jgi:hypothetical protein